MDSLSVYVRREGWGWVETCNEDVKFPWWVFQTREDFVSGQSVFYGYQPGGLTVGGFDPPSLCSLSQNWYMVS